MGTIIHVAETGLNENTGMGRVAGHWKQACEQRGHEFVHLGPEEIGQLPHKALFPRAAYRAYRALGKKADLFLIHEPASGAFVRRGIPTVVFSHGLERRGWELMLKHPTDWDARLRWRTRLLFPLWRLRPCDAGLRGAEAVLLINQDDADDAAARYHVTAERSHVFKNGVYLSDTDETQMPAGRPSILFMGTWSSRKGVKVLARAAALLRQAGTDVAWTLAGTGVVERDVLSDWPAELARHTTVIPRYLPQEESALLRGCHLFVLPSFFEGQPLALLQAMEAGRCCIASNCCGQKDFIQARKNGLLHPPGDAEALRQLIEECIRDERLRRELGRNARRAMQDRSWEIVAADVAGKIESVMQHGRFAS
jgi:glycosyltransferase involved in cell wall biosynthesis